MGATAESQFTKVIKRRKSRHSTRNFSNVDFEYIGNTGNFEHLIKPRPAGPANYSQLDFELGLRNYRSIINQPVREQFEFPATKLFSPSKQEKPEEQREFGYSDKFKMRNTNQMRFMLNPTKGPNVDAIKWQCDLRTYGGPERRDVPASMKKVGSERS